MEFNFAGFDIRAVIAIVGLVVCLIIVVASFRGQTAKARRRLRGRMQRVKQTATGGPRRTTQALSVKRRTEDSSFAQLDKLIKRFLPRPELLRERLSRTGRSTTLGEYVLVNLILTLFAAYGFHKMLEFTWASSLLAGVAVGLGVPHVVVGFIIRRRVDKFIDLFPEAIDLIIRGLKSGLPVPESIKVVGEELSEPVGGEFRTIAQAIKLGSTLEEALWAATKRISIPEFKFFVISLSVQRETGGNLTETLENLTDILRKRRAMKGKIRAMSSEAKTSAIILGSLPFILFGLIMILNPGYVGQLFEDPRGVMMVAAGCTSLLVGVAIMMKMIKFEI